MGTVILISCSPHLLFCWLVDWQVADCSTGGGTQVPHLSGKLCHWLTLPASPFISGDTAAICHSKDRQSGSRLQNLDANIAQDTKNFLDYPQTPLHYCSWVDGDFRCLAVVCVSTHSHFLHWCIVPFTHVLSFPRLAWSWSFSFLGAGITNMHGHT